MIAIAHALEIEWDSAARWLAEPPATTTIDATIRRLAGLAACGFASHDPMIVARWKGAHHALNERAAESAGDRFPACDPYLVAFVAAAARAHGWAIDGFSDDLALLAKQLATRPPSLRPHPRAFALRRLLCALAYDVIADPAELAACEIPDLAALLTADATTLANLTEWIVQATHAGTSFVALQRVGAPSDVTDALVAIAVVECRAYRLATAAEMVRALQACGIACTELEEVRNYLVLQQRSDGAFGYRNPFVSKPAEDDATRFHLPISLAIVTALSEQRCGSSLTQTVVEALR